jgi:putative ABC transport system substrate-binding protein
VQNRIVGRIVLVMLLVSSGLLPGGAGAAERTRPIRIGVLTDSWGSTPWTVSLRDGLVALGYHEDEDFVLGVRFTQGDTTALPAAARALVQSGADIIIVAQANAAKAAQQATTQIPIVFIGVPDPLRLGLIQSFAQPGGNITGVTGMALTLGPKRLEVFRELVPGLKRVLVPYDPADAYAMEAVKVYREAAHRLGIVLVEKPVRTEEEVQATLAQIRKAEVDGLLTSRSLSLNIPGFVLKAASQQGIPTMFEGAFWVEEHGALASYGPDYRASSQQAARLVDKILKGTDPADLPVEVNTKIKFVINLKTARALGLTIAPEVLYRANRLVR